MSQRGGHQHQSAEHHCRKNQEPFHTAPLLLEMSAFFPKARQNRRSIPFPYKFLATSRRRRGADFDAGEMSNANQRRAAPRYGFSASMVKPEIFVLGGSPLTWSCIWPAMFNATTKSIFVMSST